MSMSKKELKKLLYFGHPKKNTEILWDYVKSTPVLSRVSLRGSVALAVHDEGTDFTYTNLCFDQHGEVFTPDSVVYQASSSASENVAISGVSFAGAVLTVDDTVPTGTTVYISCVATKGATNIVSNILTATVTHADVSVYEALVADEDNSNETLDIPVAGETATETYAVKALSQYEVEMPGVNYANVNWTIPTPVTGCSVGAHTGVLTLDGDLIASAGSVTLHASYTLGTVTKTCDITVDFDYAESVATSIEITAGTPAPVIPVEGQTTVVNDITAVVLDQYGEVIAEPTIVWTATAVMGFSIVSGTGVVTLADTVVENVPCTVTATIGSIIDTAVLTPVKAASVVTTIEVEGSEDITAPTEGTSTHNYTAVVLNQYGDVMSEETCTFAMTSETPASDATFEGNTLSIPNTTVSTEIVITATSVSTPAKSGTLGVSVTQHA